jgi:hypothetical protein
MSCVFAAEWQHALKNIFSFLFSFFFYFYATNMFRDSEKIKLYYIFSLVCRRNKEEEED